MLLFAWNLIRICHIIHPCLLTPSDPYYPTFWCSKFSYCGSIVAWWRDENKPHIFGLKIMVLCYGEGDNWVQYVGQNNIHDAIKQNESEVAQIRFAFFWLIVYIMCKATFYNRSHWNLLIVSKDMGSWRVAKQWQTKKLSALFGCILKLVFASSASFCLITSHRSIVSHNTIWVGKLWYKSV